MKYFFKPVLRNQTQSDWENWTFNLHHNQHQTRPWTLDPGEPPPFHPHLSVPVSSRFTGQNQDHQNLSWNISNYIFSGCTSALRQHDVNYSCSAAFTGLRPQHFNSHFTLTSWSRARSRTTKDLMSQLICGLSSGRSRSRSSSSCERRFVKEKRTGRLNRTKTDDGSEAPTGWLINDEEQSVCSGGRGRL